MKKKAAPDAWKIEKDEFHPDVRVAAKYADIHATEVALANAKKQVADLEKRLKELTES